MVDTDWAIVRALSLGLMSMDADHKYGEVRSIQEREEARVVATRIREMAPDLDVLAQMCAELEHKSSPHIARDYPTSDFTHGPDLFRVREYNSGYPEETPWDDESGEPEPPTWAESNGLAEVQEDFMRRLKLFRMEQRDECLRVKRRKAAEKREAKRLERQSKIVRILSDDQVNMLSTSASHYSVGNVHYLHART